MDKKHILILTDWYEPGYKAGGPIQSCRHFIAAMHDLYTISVLTSDRDIGDVQAYPGIQTGQWISQEPGISIYYAEVKTLTSRLITQLILSRKPDFLYLNSMYSYRFSILPLLLTWRRKIQVQVMLSPRGMLQQGALKFKAVKKKLFIFLLKRIHIPERIYFHATDPQEKKDILHWFPKAGKVEMIPNFSGAVPSSGLSVEKIPGQLRCVYISRIIPKKNLLFFLKLLNLIPEQMQLEFTIYGEVEDEKYWQQAQSVMHFLPKNTNILYRGPLPHEQVMSTLGEHHIFVLPSRAENFGHAIFEALSAGRPVLISDKTPWLNLREEKVGWDLALDDHEGWIIALKEAAGFDQAVFDDWSERCRCFARNHQEKTNLRSAYIQLFS